MSRKCHLLVGLGLAVAVVLTLGVSSAAAAVPSLTGETLTGASSQGNERACLTPTFSVSGTAAGPYAGTFTESGTWEQLVFSFSAGFTVTSGTTTITGTKSFSRTTPGLSGFFDCGGDPATMDLTGVPFTATIDTPSGSFHDEGTSSLDVLIYASGAATLTETFTSSLPEPVPVAPTGKDQCKRGSWTNFPQFKNQGKCVSSLR